MKLFCHATFYALDHEVYAGADVFRMVSKTSWVILSDTEDDPFLQKITIFRKNHLNSKRSMISSLLAQEASFTRNMGKGTVKMNL